MNTALTYCVNYCCSEIVSSEEAEQKLPAVPWRSAASSHACCCSRLRLAGQELPRNTAHCQHSRGVGSSSCSLCPNTPLRLPSVQPSHARSYCWSSEELEEELAAGALGFGVTQGWVQGTKCMQTKDGLC